MNSQEFYNQVNKTAGLLQRKAQKLTSDMNEARMLYLNTIHLGAQRRETYRNYSDFQNWMLSIMLSQASSK